MAAAVSPRSTPERSSSSPVSASRSQRPRRGAAWIRDFSQGTSSALLEREIAPRRRAARRRFVVGRRHARNVAGRQRQREAGGGQGQRRLDPRLLVFGARGLDRPRPDPARSRDPAALTVSIPWPETAHRLADPQRAAALGHEPSGPADQQGRVRPPEAASARPPPRPPAGPRSPPRSRAARTSRGWRHRPVMMSSSEFPVSSSSPRRTPRARG